MITTPCGSPILSPRAYGYAYVDGVPPQAAYQLHAEADALERRLRFAVRNGHNPYEAHELDVRIGQLEQRQLRFSRYRGYGYNNYDRNREGRRGGRGRERDDD